MDRLDNIGENEIRIIGTNSEEQSKVPHKNYWPWVGLAAAILIVAGLLLWHATGNEAPQPQPPVAVDTVEVAKKDSAFVMISDTIINNVSLHCFIPVHAKPKLVMGVLKAIPDEYILGAMATDFGITGKQYQVAGAFVYHGEMMSHSKSKYGFCAILKDTLVIGCDLTTSYFEQAIEEKGDFFRQHALVYDGKVVNSVISQNESLRRSLCRLGDGRICIIDTDMSVSLDTFSTALCQYGVVEGIALMGSGAAVRWAVDKAGRRYIAGADEYDFPDVVNYIVWERN